MNFDQLRQNWTYLLMRWLISPMTASLPIDRQKQRTDHNRDRDNYILGIDIRVILVPPNRKAIE
jgi:hypothetical protein